MAVRFTAVPIHTGLAEADALTEVGATIVPCTTLVPAVARQPLTGFVIVTAYAPADDTVTDEVVAPLLQL